MVYIVRVIALTLLTPICHVAFSEYTPLKKSSKSLYTVFPSCLFALLPCCQLTLPRLSETEILAMLGNIISAKHDGGINRITNLHNYSCTNDTNTQENNILYIYIYTWKITCSTTVSKVLFWSILRQGHIVQAAIQPIGLSLFGAQSMAVPAPVNSSKTNRRSCWSMAQVHTTPPREVMV
jgi:hypothetical protein